MPFTLDGTWIPESKPSKPNKPVKIIKEKRGQAIVTVIRHLPLATEELKKLCSTLKQRLGCGGSVKEENIELQGDKVQQAQDLLKQQGFLKNPK